MTSTEVEIPGYVAASWTIDPVHTHIGFVIKQIIVPRDKAGNPITVKGWLYGNRHQFFVQLFAALTIIIYDALMTFIILRIIKFFTLFFVDGIVVLLQVPVVHESHQDLQTIQFFSS